MNALNVKTALPQFVGAGGRDFAGLINRIVQHLDLEKLPWIVQFAHGTKQTLGYVHLVKNWQLHRHRRQLFKVTGRNRCALPVFEIQINDEVAMDTVRRKTDEHTQIADGPDNVSEASLHWSFHRCY